MTISLNPAFAPKDILTYASRFLEFTEIVRCRKVCKLWRAVINDPINDELLFGRFYDGKEPLVGPHPYFESAKIAYLNEIALRDVVRMNEEANEIPTDCCHNCCAASAVNCMVVSSIMCFFCTCCCCCTCFRGGQLPML